MRNLKDVENLSESEKESVLGTQKRLMEADRQREENKLSMALQALE